MFAKTFVFAWGLGFVPIDCKNTHRGNWLEIEVGKKTFKVDDYGAKGDGKHDDTKAVQSALDDAGKEGGEVQFGDKKTYKTTAWKVTGSKTTINLPKHSTVKFDDDRSKYDKSVNSLIHINRGLDDIGIIGGGTFDGQGKVWWDCCGKGNTDFRPLFVMSDKGHRLLIKDVTFKDSPNHNLEMGSDYTEITGVKISAPKGSYNTDGIDVHGSPFYVNNCDIDVGDDNIAVHDSHLLVENCKIGHGHGTSIGAIASNTHIQNITFRDMTYENTHSAVHIKTRTGATNSYVKDVTWEGLEVHNVRETIRIEMFYGDCECNKTTGVEISDITVRDVTAYGTKTDDGKKMSPGSVSCQESSQCKNLHFSNIQHVDTKEPWECYNAQGDVDNVSPDFKTCDFSSAGGGRRRRAAKIVGNSIEDEGVVV